MRRKTERFRPTRNLPRLTGRRSAKPVIDGQNAKSRGILEGFRPACGEPHQSRRIAAAGNGKGDMPTRFKRFEETPGFRGRDRPV
jgi:hypothetical protein